MQGCKIGIRVDGVQGCGTGVRVEGVRLGLLW